MDNKTRFNTRQSEPSVIARTLYSVFTMPVTLQAHGELRMFLLRLRSKRIPRHLHNKKNLKVNLGSGTRSKPDWINVDGRKLDGVDIVCDLRRRIPLPDNCARLIFCEHVLEHLDYHQEVPCFLSECLRILQPGGRLRIIVPDAGKYLASYCEDGWKTLCEIRPLDADHVDLNSGIVYKNKMELINEVFRQGFEHKYAYDSEALRGVLTAAGLSDVRELSYGKTGDDEAPIDAEARRGESLYVEGVKSLE